MYGIFFFLLFPVCILPSLQRRAMYFIDQTHMSTLQISLYVARFGHHVKTQNYINSARNRRYIQITNKYPKIYTHVRDQVTFDIYIPFHLVFPQLSQTELALNLKICMEFGFGKFLSITAIQYLKDDKNNIGELIILESCHKGKFTQ